MELRIGNQIKGYELKEQIGSGGFGAVYRAHQSTVDREVAIKIILPGMANQPDFIRRFEAEAHLIARLEHMNIVPLYDYWRDPDGAYLVMRWLRGGSLLDLLKSQGALTIEETVTMLEQVAQALQTAHRSQVIHRDIKPGNILLDEDGNAYLADFGIAKDYALTDGHTSPDAIVGSPDYLAPEQARSEAVTPQTDIYSLGVVIYEMLSGEHPFPNLNTIERLYKHLNEPLPELTTLEDSICKEINKVIQKATSKNPQQRFKDVLTLTQDLREAAGLDREATSVSLVELLTPREQEVLKLLIEGKSNREIADALVVEVATVKWYNKNIYRKLNVRSRIQAIVKARELDLIVGKTDTHESSISYLPEPANPYKGLRAFQAADAQDFFGREKLTQKLLSRLQENGEHYRFLTVVGPSGSGKSSVVKAGLIPVLWRGDLPGSENWYIVDLVPGSRPLDELEVALFQIASDKSINLREQLQRDTFGLLRIADMILPDDDSELLIVIDQFEEVFTLLESQEERLHFLNLISEAVTDKRSRVRVVVTLRADYYDRPLQYPDFGELIRNRVETVLPLSAEELERAIIEPANRVGVNFEDGLVSRIVSDVHYQPGALPLLQYALTELFERRDGRKLTMEAYQAIGGTGGALANRADEIYLEGNEASQELVKQLFLRLVTLGEGAEDTRRRVERSELLAITPDTELMNEIIDLYAASRLLSLDNDPATRRPTVEVAHEAILREWDRLRQWLNDSRDDIRQERQVAQAAEAWQENNGDKSYLLRGSRLEQAENWQQQTQLSLTPLLTEFVRTSIEQREAETQAEIERQEREQAQEQRSHILLRALVAVFALAAILSGGFGLIANTQRIRAEASEHEALRQASIGLAAQAVAELDSDAPERGVLLALKALENYPYTPQAERALAQTVYATRPYTELTMMDGLATTRATAFSPDGTHIVSVSAEYDAVIWDVATGDHRIIGNSYVAADERRAYIDVDWSPDGTHFVVVAAANEGAAVGAGMITIWQLPNEENIASWPGHDGEDIWAVDWSSDSQFIVTGGGDNQVRFWNADTHEEMQSLSSHTDSIQAVAISPDDSRLASGSSDTTIRIWDVQTGETLHILSGHLGTVNALDWSPDGSQIISAGDDGLTIIWDATSGDIQQTLLGHTGSIRYVAWSPDGALVATASADGTARIWDTISNSVVSTLQGTIRGLSWSPDSTKLVVGIGQGTLRMWDMSQRPLRLIGHEAGLIDGKWTADSSRIVTSAFDGTAHVWNAVNGELLLTFLNHKEAGVNPIVADISISSDSQWVATTGTDNYVRVWNIETGEERLTFSDLYSSREFSPDGSRLAIVGDDRALIVDFETDEILHDFDPEYGEGGCYSIRMAWSPDGRYFVVPCFAKPRADVWDSQTSEHVITLEHDEVVTASDWTFDGTRILTADASGLIHIWDAENGELLYDFTAHTSLVWDVELSPDGSRVASGDDTGRVRIWDIETRQEVNSYDVGFSILDVYWSPDGTQLLTTGIRPIPDIRHVWQSTEELVDYAYECCVFRTLTAEERQKFGLPDP